MHQIMNYLHVGTQNPHNYFSQAASRENGQRGIHRTDFLEYKYHLGDAVVPLTPKFLQMLG